MVLWAAGAIRNRCPRPHRPRGGSDAGREATWRPRLPDPARSRPPLRDFLEAKPYPHPAAAPRPSRAAAEDTRPNLGIKPGLRDPGDACGTQGTLAGRRRRLRPGTQLTRREGGGAPEREKERSRSLTGGPSKEHGTNKPPPTRRVWERSKGDTTGPTTSQNPSL